MHPSTVPYKYLVAAIYVVALFMDLLDVTIVNVALPAIGRDFGVGPGAIEWVVTGYLLSLAVWVPASGWLCRRYGTRRVFLISVAIFTAGSLLCGLAWNAGALVAFRMVQGIGGGMLTPVGTTMLFRVFLPAERPRVGAILLVPSLIAPAIGPIVGGWLATAADWRWIFLINAPGGLAALAFGACVLREDQEPEGGRFDLWGFAGSGAGLALLLYALSHGPGAGWNATVLATGLAGIVLLVLVAVVELHIAEPMLHLRLLADRSFCATNVYFFAVLSGWTGVLFLMPLYLQDLRGQSALQSGLTTFPQAVGLILTIRLSSRLARSAHRRRLLVGGAVAIAAATAPLLLLDAGTSLWAIRGLLLVRGLALGLIAVTLQTAPFATITPRDMGHASALYSVNRHVCGALGVAVLATVLLQSTRLGFTGSAAGAAPAAALSGFHAAFAVAILTSLVAAGLGFLVRDATVTTPSPARAPREAALGLSGGYRR